MRASKLFHDLAGPILYRRITFDAKQISSPLTVLSKAPQSRQLQRDRTKKEDLLKNVTHLTIVSLGPRGWYHVPRFDFPGIQCLVLGRETVRETYANCKQIALVYDHLPSPPKLVIKSLLRLSNGAVMDRLMKDTKRLSLVILPESTVALSLPDILYLLDIVAYLAPTLISLTIIFWTRSAYVQWRPLPIAPPAYGGGVFRGSWVGRFLTQIAAEIKHRRFEITFVNMGMLDRNSAGEDRWDERVIQSKVEKYFREALGKDSKRNETVRFMGMKEYLKEGDWEDEFEREEIKEWLQ
ncbi:hypothetical protein P7C73_g4823, partial [Tremellales sp. Uapishka_1]